MGDVVDLEIWRTRRDRRAPPAPPVKPPLPLKMTLAVMLSLPLVVTIAALSL